MHAFAQDTCNRRRERGERRERKRNGSKWPEECYCGSVIQKMTQATLQVKEEAEHKCTRERKKRDEVKNERERERERTKCETR